MVHQRKQLVHRQRPQLCARDRKFCARSLQNQNYLKNCVGCHITGIRSNGATPQGEYVTHPYPAVLVPDNGPNYPDLDGDGIPDLAGIGCESCHGPGSKHILSGGDPAKIINPVDIGNNQQRSAVCQQCHSQSASAPGKTWGYPYNETDKKPFIVANPPDDLSRYQVFKGGLWPEGVHYIAAGTDDFKSSAHFQSSGGIACNDCHDAMTETTILSKCAMPSPTTRRGPLSPRALPTTAFVLPATRAAAPFSPSRRTKSPIGIATSSRPSDRPSRFTRIIPTALIGPWVFPTASHATWHRPQATVMRQILAHHMAMGAPLPPEIRPLAEAPRPWLLTNSRA